MMVSSSVGGYLLGELGRPPLGVVDELFEELGGEHLPLAFVEALVAVEEAVVLHVDGRLPLHLLLVLESPRRDV